MPTNPDAPQARRNIKLQKLVDRYPHWQDHWIVEGLVISPGSEVGALTLGELRKMTAPGRMKDAKRS